MKIKPLSPISVATALGVLAEANVSHPRHIHAEALAVRNGARVLYGPIRTASASLVRTGKHAVIWVKEEDRGQPRALFTILHEVGHLLLHALLDHFRQCDEDAGARDFFDYRIETEANHFATEVAMPEWLASPLCAAPCPTLDDVDRLTSTFRTSFTASAIRLVQLTKAPCAFVFSRDGRVKWAPESTAFPGKIVRGRALHPQSLAARVTWRRAGADAGPREVPGEAWGGSAPFVEHAIALGPKAGVMSWIAPR
jgi:hypothetical protein